MKYYNIIKEFLENNNVPNYYYSLGEYADDCVCLEYENNSWIVYNGYRGHKTYAKAFDNIKDAACELINSIIIGDNSILCACLSQLVEEVGSNPS